MARYCAACWNSIKPAPFQFTEEYAFIVPGDLGRFINGEIEHLRELCPRCSWVYTTINDQEKAAREPLDS